ncbi:carbohydrate sulfotransferase 1-like [Dreissena polymorpha]|uniref:Sulfotransferase domain-containing protein n=1 Tax=Dreissena polymorpha TaxID=45954 RepID=A0A9D4S275_DREPO|nr:carbohydrate sulfotransferase 1-like [Dreissena polymorpha]KAH3887132.1 hypothetical protein DPMN_011148 [Dreissena polymorpha]
MDLRVRFRKILLGGLLMLVFMASLVYVIPGRHTYRKARPEQSNAAIETYQEVQQVKWPLTNAQLTVQHTTTANHVSTARDHAEQDQSPAPKEEITSGPQGHLLSKIVLIFAYLRSGSTFTASLFTQLPDSFYVFEPLHALTDAIGKDGVLRYINGSVRHFPYGIEEQPDWLYREAIEHWFRCRLGHLDTASLQDDFHEQYSMKSMKPFLLCVRHKRASNLSAETAIKECLPPTEKKCRDAHLRVFKTIRLSMETVWDLLRLFDNMKVIFLVRDPRGMFVSQGRNYLIKPGKNVAQFQKICTKMNADLNVASRILADGNKNVHLVRYEDIAFNPFTAVEQLYAFIGEPLTNAVKSYVKLSTSLNIKDSCAFCTLRGNSSATATKWRHEIKPIFLRIADKYCRTVYDQLGYYPTLDLSYLRNDSLPLQANTIPLLDNTVIQK